MILWLAPQGLSICLLILSAISLESKFFMKKNSLDWLIKRNTILQMFCGSQPSSYCQYIGMFCAKMANQFGIKTPRTRLCGGSLCPSECPGHLSVTKCDKILRMFSPSWEVRGGGRGGGIYKESTRSPQHSRAEFFEVSIYYLGTVWTDCEYWHGDTENGHNEMIRVCLSQWSLTPSQSMSSESGEHHYPSHQDNAKSIFNFSQNSSHIQPGNIFKLMNLKYGYWFLKDYHFVFLARRFSSNNSKYYRDFVFIGAMV